MRTTGGRIFSLVLAVLGQTPVLASAVEKLNSRQPVTTGIIDNRKNFRDTHPEFVSLPQYQSVRAALSTLVQKYAAAPPRD